MLELAPRHKIGLPVQSRFMPAAGFFGHGGNPYPGLIEPAMFGAIVTNPITLRPRRHAETPAMLETSGGVVITAPVANPGVRQVIRRTRRAWQKSTSPVIAHLPADLPDDLARTVGALSQQKGIAGFELGVTDEDSPADVAEYIAAILSRTELPVLVKFSGADLLAQAEAACEAGADALVIETSPPASVYHGDTLITGRLFGGGVLAQGLSRVAEMKAHFPNMPLLATGGIHHRRDVLQYLQAGASAVQLDLLIFTDPQQTQNLISATLPQRD